MNATARTSPLLRNISQEPHRSNSGNSHRVGPVDLVLYGAASSAGV